MRERVHMEMTESMARSVFCATYQEMFRLRLARENVRASALSTADFNEARVAENIYQDFEAINRSMLARALTLSKDGTPPDQVGPCLSGVASRIPVCNHAPAGALTDCQNAVHTKMTKAEVFGSGFAYPGVLPSKVVVVPSAVKLVER